MSYTPIPLESVIEGMIGAGLPRPVAETYASIDTTIAEGKMAVVSSAFKDLTGDTPSTVKEFLAANKDKIQEAITA